MILPADCCEADKAQAGIRPALARRARAIERAMPGPHASEQDWRVLLRQEGGSVRWEVMTQLMSCLDEAASQPSAHLHARSLVQWLPHHSLHRKHAHTRFAERDLSVPSLPPVTARSVATRQSMAARAVRADGSLAALSDPKGEFVSGDLYPFVIDLTDPQLPMVAHGVNKALIGKPQLRVKDADGRELNRISLAIVTESGEGWVEYKWSDPLTHQIRPKLSFVRKVGD